MLSDGMHLTRLDVALPFFLAAAFVIVGGFAALLVTRRVRTFLDGEVSKSVKCANKLPYAFRPEPLSQMSQWTIDSAQILTALVAPLIGLVLLLKQGATGVLVALDLVACLVAVGGFRVFLKRDPTFYGTKSPRLMTPMLVISVLLNLFAGVVAYAIGP